MTMQTAELVAGRELDALVAEKVMGYEWRDWPFNPEQPHLVPPGYEDPHKLAWWLGRSIRELVPKYSTDIAAAWEVAEKFEDGGIAVVRAFAVVRDNRPPIDGTGGRWQAQIWTDRNEYARYVAYADTAPLAICRAALAAVEAHAVRSLREVNQS